MPETTEERIARLRAWLHSHPHSPERKELEGLLEDLAPTKGELKEQDKRDDAADAKNPKK
jgi:hypothetical protein